MKILPILTPNDTIGWLINLDGDDLCYRAGDAILGIVRDLKESSIVSFCWGQAQMQNTVDYVLRWIELSDGMIVRSAMSVHRSFGEILYGCSIMQLGRQSAGWGPKGWPS